MKRWLAASLLALSCGAFGQAAEVAAPNSKVEQRLKALAEELRCLVCQNQTIADSNAPLALDLRNQIREQVGQGKSDDDIRAYMVQRYGDFVLYKPPLKATTALLWIGPFALIAFGAALFVVIVRRRRTITGAQAQAMSPAERATIEAMLGGDPRPPKRAADRGAGSS